MITVKINTAGSLCKINLTDSLNKVKIVRRFGGKNSEWRNALIFLTLFEGTLKLFEKRAYYSAKRLLERMYSLNVLSLKILY